MLVYQRVIQLQQFIQYVPTTVNPINTHLHIPMRSPLLIIEASFPAQLGAGLDAMESNAVDLGKCYASMVQDAGWNAGWNVYGKYAEWSQNSFHRKVENSASH